jgi:hypothetical protein
MAAETFFVAVLMGKKCRCQNQDDTMTLALFPWSSQQDRYRQNGTKVGGMAQFGQFQLPAWPTT